MKRLYWLHATIVALAMGSAAFASDKPNILFILSDDHATAAMGCYGGPLAALGRMVAERCLHKR